MDLESNIQCIMKQFRILKNQSLNQLCADCDFTNTKQQISKNQRISNWVSLNYGIFLCPKCSQIHQELFSKNVSHIKPIPFIDDDQAIDNDQIEQNWSQDQIEEKIQKQLQMELNSKILINEKWNVEDGKLLRSLIKFGGNQKFNLYMQKYFQENIQMPIQQEPQDSFISEMYSQQEQDIVKNELRFSGFSSDDDQISFQETNQNYIGKLREHIYQKYNSQAAKYYRENIMLYLVDQNQIHDSNAQNQKKESSKFGSFTQKIKKFQKEKKMHYDEEWVHVQNQDYYNQQLQNSDNPFENEQESKKTQFSLKKSIFSFGKILEKKVESMGQQLSRLIENTDNQTQAEKYIDDYEDQLDDEYPLQKSQNFYSNNQNSKKVYEQFDQHQIIYKEQFQDEFQLQIEKNEYENPIDELNNEYTFQKNLLHDDFSISKFERTLKIKNSEKLLTSQIQNKYQKKKQILQQNKEDEF